MTLLMITTSLRLKRTSNITNPTSYIQALNGEFAEYAFNEERAPQFRGVWRQLAFGREVTTPLDLEIGTGNGFFFAHQAAKEPNRLLVGIEIKFKPLIQSIRRVVRMGGTNARIARYDAGRVQDLFAPEELDNVFIHFPDPWERKRRQHKNRLIQPEFLVELHKLQKPGSWLEFKTDSRDYFDWAVECFRGSPYQFTGLTYDLHQSEFAPLNFVTHFENIFLRKKQPIHWARLSKI